MKIQLSQPPDGATTPPMQRYTWPLPEVCYDDETVDAVPYKWANLEVLNEDRSRPAPVQFSWDPVGDSATLYELRVSRNCLHRLPFGRSTCRTGRGSGALNSIVRLGPWCAYLRRKYYRIQL